MPPTTKQVSNWLNKQISNWVNTTSIIFDDRLRLAALTLHEENPNGCMTLLKSSSHIDIAEGQSCIRNWFVKNQHMINIKGRRLTLSPFHMPNFYALLCLSVCDINSSHSWDNVVSQIIGTNKIHSPEDDIIFCDYTIDEIYTQCACSHTVASENTYIIRHETTHLHLLLGSDCGEKLGIISKGDFKKMKKPTIYEDLQLARKLKNEETARIKNKSKRLAIKWGEMVERYSHSIKTYRPCISCEVRCILHSEGMWKKRCKPCWFKDCGPRRTNSLY